MALRSRHAVALWATLLGCAAPNTTPAESSGEDDGECTIGSEGCPCTEGGVCDPGLQCLSNICVDATGSESAEASSSDAESSSDDTAASMDDSSSGDGDSTTDTTGDGDSTDSTGDGDSATDTTGDGDSTTDTTGDGDSSTDTTGDGDSTTSTTGDGDSTTSTTGDGDSTTSTTGDGDSTTDTTGDGDCTTPEFTVTWDAPSVMLVVDKSGSMVSNTWDHDANAGSQEVTRWWSLHSSTDLFLDSFEQSINFGLQLFPNNAATNACANTVPCESCFVSSVPDVGLALDNRSSILALMPAQSSDSSTIQGATPAAGAMVSAKTALDDAVSSGGTNPALVFITDGAANCGLQYAGETCMFPGDGTSASCKLMDYFDSELEGLIGGYYTDDAIPTYVVGIGIEDVILDPESDFDFITDATNVYDELNDIAVAGGVPLTGGTENFYHTTNEFELNDALSTIGGELSACSFDLTEAPYYAPTAQQIPNVGFEVGGNEVLGPLGISVAECAAGTQSGWIWVESGVRAMLCGSACSDMRQEGGTDTFYDCAQ